MSFPSRLFHAKKNNRESVATFYYLLFLLSLLWAVKFSIFDYIFSTQLQVKTLMKTTFRYLKAMTGHTHHGPANRLAHEKSPYLLQHAHNPVDWYPWGDEAFKVARETNRPVFLSGLFLSFPLPFSSLKALLKF